MPGLRPMGVLDPQYYFQSPQLYIILYIIVPPLSPREPADPKVAYSMMGISLPNDGYGPLARRFGSLFRDCENGRKHNINKSLPERKTTCRCWNICKTFHFKSACAIVISFYWLKSHALNGIWTLQPSRNLRTAHVAPCGGAHSKNAPGTPFLRFWGSTSPPLGLLCEPEGLPGIGGVYVWRDCAQKNLPGQRPKGVLECEHQPFFNVIQLY